MTTTELEQVIRDYIKDIYKKEYIGKIEIETLKPRGYCVRLGMQVPQKPVVIYAELDDKSYLKFIKQEIKDRLFHLVRFSSVSLAYPYDSCPRDTKCSCNDKGRIN